MKSPKALVPFFCCLLALSASAAYTIPVFSQNFEADTIGAAPTSFTTISNDVDTTIQVVGGGPSGNYMRIVDNNASGVTPLVSKTLATNYSEYTYSFDYLMGVGGDIQRTEFFATNGAGGKRLDFRMDGGRLHLKLNGPDDVATSILFTAMAGWNAGGWNTFSYDVSDSAGTVTAFVNGVEALTYTDVGNLLNWSAGRVTIYNGYGGTNNNTGNYDNILFAVPEPSVVLLSLLGMSLLARRRR